LNNAIDVEPDWSVGQRAECLEEDVNAFGRIEATEEAKA
jgi:hypothetical protein